MPFRKRRPHLSLCFLSLVNCSLGGKFQGEAPVLVQGFSNYRFMDGEFNIIGRNCQLKKKS